MTNRKRQIKAVAKAELAKIDKEQNRQFFNKYHRNKDGKLIERKESKLVPKATPRTVFIETAIGREKRESSRFTKAYYKEHYA